MFFFSLILRPPPTSTLFPYTTLFRSSNSFLAIASKFALRAVAVGVHPRGDRNGPVRSEEHTSELQSRQYLVCRLLLEKKNRKCQSYRWDTHRSAKAPSGGTTGGRKRP